MNRLIIVEGLPCSGKSTTSKYIADKINALYFDEGSGDHPADYEFHAFIKDSELKRFSDKEQELIIQNAVAKNDGYVVSLRRFSNELFDKLLQYKIYDFLPWETEKPVMLDKWREFVNSANSEEKYVFNCVLLQNPMCETMMRFGFDIQKSFEYIKSICDIIKPLNPFIVYLSCDNIRKAIEDTASERGADWLNSVIDYHCNGVYGKSEDLHGFDGYITALEERQKREFEILRNLNVQHMIINDPSENWENAYHQIINILKE
ncbi:MAG: hypothetical protein ACI4KF_03040 [Huintestinicola sp.]